MYQGLTIGVVIPARDEADNIGAVVGGLLELHEESGQRVIDDLVVCDNGSADATAQQARSAGARVVVEDTPGYGIACLTALAALRPVDVVLFVDGDQSCETGQAVDLLRAIAGRRGHGRRFARAGSDGAGRPVGAADRRQPRRVAPDSVVVGQEGDRPGAVSRHPS